MPDFLGLTSVEQIRGVLTTTESNLSDEMILSYGLGDDLGVMLDAALPTWELVLATGTEAQKRLLRMVGKYFCAARLASTATLWVLKKETDGSNEGQRSDKEGYTYLAAEFSNRVDKALSDLLDLLDLPQPETPITVFISRLVPGRDPITQPRG